jgi:hypothetical protein
VIGVGIVRCSSMSFESIYPHRIKCSVLLSRDNDKNSGRTTGKPELWGPEQAVPCYKLKETADLSSPRPS